ncbi:MAG: Fis family transcriptional regulator [Betaproteobacteria bacterium]|nr:Fis family transcriptional regulator [Betaproteobacteria bacterium]
MANRPARRVENENDIGRCVRRALDAYFRDLDGERPAPLHDMVMACVEMPLLEYVMAQVEGNQTLAAEILGMNRNTLRKKLKFYGLI